MTDCEDAVGRRSRSNDDADPVIGYYNCAFWRVACSKKKVLRMEIEEMMKGSIFVMLEQLERTKIHLKEIGLLLMKRNCLVHRKVIVLRGWGLPRHPA